jgi:carbamoyltransferase
MRKETGLKNLCMAGGVALNCTMNGAIARSGLFDNIFIQPAANDEGCSIGAALYTYSQLNQVAVNNNETWNHAYWGPEYSEDEILLELKNYSERIKWEKHQNIGAFTAGKLKDGKVIGWFQGRMEFGPRALGNRSILADPRDPEMRNRINEKIKRRESFRPFAPSVLQEDAKVYFDMTGLADSPFMLFAVPVNNKYKNIIPAVTHVDGSARVQTVSKNSNPLFWDLISEYKNLTGVPVVLNTSFNVRNEPIVCSPKDAILCFLSTDIDYLVIGNFFIIKR